MTEFVRHDAGDFAFRLRGFDHPAVDEHRPARQREGIYVRHVEQLESEVEPALPGFGSYTITAQQGRNGFRRRSEAAAPFLKST